MQHLHRFAARAAAVRLGRHASRQRERKAQLVALCLQALRGQHAPHLAAARHAGGQRHRNAPQQHGDQRREPSVFVRPLAVARTPYAHAVAMLGLRPARAQHRAVLPRVHGKKRVLARVPCGGAHGVNAALPLQISAHALFDVVQFLTSDSCESCPPPPSGVTKRPRSASTAFDRAKAVGKRARALPVRPFIVRPCHTDAARAVQRTACRFFCGFRSGLLLAAAAALRRSFGQNSHEFSYQIRSSG